MHPIVCDIPTQTSTEAADSIYIDPRRFRRMTLDIKNPTPGTVYVERMNADGTWTDPDVLATSSATVITVPIAEMSFKRAAATDVRGQITGQHAAAANPLRVRWSGNTGTITVTGSGVEEG